MPSPGTESGTREHTLEILVVEDDPDIADTLSEVLKRQNHRATVLHDGDAALRSLESRVFDLLLCDIRLPGTDGLTILRHVRSRQPDLPVILMSAYGSISEAVSAVQHDAADYLEKPFSLDELLEAISAVQERIELRRELDDACLQDLAHTTPIIGHTPAIESLRRQVRTLAAAVGPVLITGETGTGKELVAGTLHALSDRRAKPFIGVNCAAFPDTLLEAELFGHERGAFTGAVRRREGRFRAAHGGTLFLDEVGDMPAGAQAKLLRVLEERVVQPLGSDRGIEVDVRIVSATNADLRAGGFREDLYYRLKMFHVHVPPLRERQADLPLLVQHLAGQIAAGSARPAFTPRAWAGLRHYDFPGNVRELRHAVAHGLALSGGGDIDLIHLPEEIRGAEAVEPRDDSGALPLAQAEKEFERHYLLRALKDADWNKTRTADRLNISRKTLWKKLRKHGIE